MRTFRQHFSLPGLLQALLALAVLVAPVTANEMGAAKAATEAHHQTAKDAGHCSSAPYSGSKHEKAAGKACCAAMCVGVAVALPPASASVAPVKAMIALPVSTSLIASPQELPTPPPRLA